MASRRDVRNWAEADVGYRKPAAALQHAMSPALRRAQRGLPPRLGAMLPQPCGMLWWALWPPLVSAPARVDPTAYQVSVTEGPGLVAAKAQLGRSHYEGFVRDAPAPVGLSVGNAREAARAALAGQATTDAASAG